MLWLALLLSTVLGASLVRWLWPARSGDRWLVAALGFGVGVGCVSVLDYAGRNAFGGLGWSGRLALELLVAGVSVVGAIAAGRRRGGEGNAGDVRPAPQPAWSGFAVGVSVLLGVGALAYSFVAMQRLPFGTGDAQLIWNLRASMLFGAGEQWQRAFDPAVPHPDYPLLLPAYVARTWSFVGARDGVTSTAVAVAFLASTVVAVGGFVSALRGRAQGFAAAAVLLGSFAFVHCGASQYADVPLAFYYLAACGLVTLQDRFDASGQRWSVLAGVALGCAAWTKNEGMLFLCTFGVVRAVSLLSASGPAGLRRALPLAVGALPFLVAVVWFKCVHAPVNDLVDEAARGGAIARVLDGERYVRIAAGMWTAAARVGPWLLLGLAMHLAFARRGVVWWVVAVAAVQFAGYVAVFLVTSADLAWHLDTAADRLLLHLFPLVVLAVLCGRPGGVEEVGARDSEGAA